MIVTKDNYPNLRAAFETIERDSGGHLIGVVYPGEAIDLDAFEVPEAWSHLVAKAERGLARLAARSADEFETFVCGEQSEAESIEACQGDLVEAHTLLNDYFEGWPSECAPPSGAS